MYHFWIWCLEQNTLSKIKYSENKISILGSSSSWGWKKEKKVNNHTVWVVLHTSWKKNIYHRAEGTQHS